MTKSKTIMESDEMSRWSRETRKTGKGIAIVPTMGALHEGHLALMREARKHGDVVVTSIFVNPKQFNDPKDFEKYGRDLEGDLKKCEVVGVDAVFAPSVEEMYPKDWSRPDVKLPQVALRLEGASRPGHFEGVITAVSRLFEIVKPHTALFGLKDYQQVRVIEDMVAAEKIPVQIVRHPTVREKNGLAMSSRNVRLSQEGRKKALFLFNSLKAAQYLFEKGERKAEVIRSKIEKGLTREEIKVDYVALVDAVSLQDVSSIDRPCLLALAVFIEDVRLIDNCLLRDN